MRRLAISLVFIAAASAFGQFPSTPVTFTCRASTADHALAALSRTAGVQLFTNETSAHEVLVISVKGTPLADLMKRIATATSSEWIPQGTGFMLVGSESVRRQEEAQALAARTAAIRKVIKDGMAPPKTDKKGDATQGDQSVGTPFAPSSAEQRYVYQVLNAADVPAIAEVGVDQRLVFATRPTAMQRAFSEDITEPINAIVAAHNAHVAKNPKPDDSGLDPTQGALSDAMSMSFMRDMMDRMTKPIVPVSQVLLVISRIGLGGLGLNQAELRMYDATGKLAYSQSVSIDLPGTGMASLMASVADLNPNAPKTAAPVKATPVDLSDDTKAISSIFAGSVMGRGASLSLTPDLKNKLFHPDKYDPLSYMATDEVLSLAKKRGQPVVAALPDDAVSVTALVLSSKAPTVEQYEKELNGGAVSQVVPDPGWLMIRPSHAAEARSGHLDREALATLMKAADESGVASLDDVAAYSLRAPSPMEGGIGAIYVMFFVPGAFSQSLSGLTSWETLRIYGTLDPVRRESLLSGGRIPFASLTSYQQDQVKQMAYGAMPMLEVDDPSHKDGGGMLPAYMRLFMGGGGDYRDEPTEVLPNGLPGDGFVSLKTSAESFAAPVATEGKYTPGTNAVMDSETLATYKMLKEMPAMSAYSSMFPSPSQVRIGQLTTYSFTFQVASKVSIHSMLRDHHLDKNSAIVSMNSLPSDFQKQIDAKYAEVKKSPIGALTALSGMGAGAGIHP